MMLMVRVEVADKVEEEDLVIAMQEELSVLE